MNRDGTVLAEIIRSVTIVSSPGNTTSAPPTCRAIKANDHDLEHRKDSVLIRFVSIGLSSGGIRIKCKH